MLIEPSEIVILTRLVKQSIRKKLSLPQDITDIANHWKYLHHQMKNLPNESLSDHLKAAMPSDKKRDIYPDSYSVFAKINQKIF